MIVESFEGGNKKKKRKTVQGVKGGTKKGEKERWSKG